MIQVSDEKEVIRALQAMLRSIQIARGETVTVPTDGIYGTATRTAVESIQRENELPVTGEVDRTTYDRVYSLALDADLARSKPLPLYAFPNGRILRVGEVSDLVVMVQIILNTLTVGYDDFTLFALNGHYTEETAVAVRRFQMRNGLSPSGDIDKATWNALVRNYDLYRDAGA